VCPHGFIGERFEILSGCWETNAAFEQKEQPQVKQMIGIAHPEQVFAFNQPFAVIFKLGELALGAQ
jgi:hypothetical protein